MDLHQTMKDSEQELWEKVQSIRKQVKIISYISVDVIRHGDDMSVVTSLHT